MGSARSNSCAAGESYSPPGANRNRKFVDSLLEGTGFELLVRGRGKRAMGSAAEEPIVCGLSAGGKWIRTIGTCKLSYRFHKIEIGQRLGFSESAPTRPADLGKTKPRHGEYRGFYGWRLVFGGQSPSYLRYHTRKC
jgi:hypothetical protein